MIPSLFSFLYRYSVLPAISLDGVLHIDILRDQSWNGDSFYTFIDTLTATKMQAYPAANSVLVMDNCSIHRVQGIRELVESR
jgi:hypothetical protein